MRNLLLVTAIAMFPACAARAEQFVIPRAEQHGASDRLPPTKRAGSLNACAAYGPGFVKLAGSDTCVKTGGAVSIGVGASR